MIVVSDTSPLLNLARVGRADMLCLLHGEILAPGIVAVELMRNGVVPDSIGCLTVREPLGEAVVRRLELEIDPGESAAIALALETGADLLLVDERKGGTKAIAMGLEVGGVLGVVIDAKRRELLPAGKPLPEALEQDAGFWISAQFRARFLELVGEP